MQNSLLKYDSKKDINIDTFIITVPTPVDNNNKPNISSLLKACKFVGKMIKKNI